MRFFSVRLGISLYIFFFFNDTATTEIYTLSLHDALPIFLAAGSCGPRGRVAKLAGVSEPICAGESHRSKAGAHLRAGQPAAEPQGAPGTASDGAHKIEPAKRRWKRRSVEKSENRLFPSAWESRKRRGIPTFPPPQQQQP